jgi:hypothetical protein
VFGLRLATGRGPDDAETRLLAGNLQAQLEYFRGHSQEAAQLLAVGEKRNDPKLNAEELAAYSVVASLILNLDEVITKQ